MNSYLLNFAVYTFAMIGFIALALFIYKKSIYCDYENKNKEFLRVENSLRLSAAKTIYVLKAGSEKFLIAADAANTTMLAKLNQNNKSENYEILSGSRLCSTAGSSPKEKITEFSEIKKQTQRISRG